MGGVKVTHRMIWLENVDFSQASAKSPLCVLAVLFLNTFFLYLLVHGIVLKTISLRPHEMFLFNVHNAHPFLKKIGSF